MPNFCVKFRLEVLPRIFSRKKTAFRAKRLVFPVKEAYGKLNEVKHMDWISKQLTSLVIQKNIAPESDREYYDYCFSALLSTLLNFLAVFVVALLSGTLIETLCYLTGFLLLRRTAGGYHAKTSIRCFIMSVGFYLSFLAILFYLPLNFRPIVLVGGNILSTIIVFTLAPVEHENRPFTNNERRIFRKGSLMIAGISFLSSFVLVAIFPLVSQGSFLFSYNLGYLSIAISLFMAWVHNILFLKSEPERR